MKPEATTVTLGTGITLSYAAVGRASDPTVVLLPGPTDSWRSYDPVLDRLPPRIRAIAVSLRGHGDSDKPPDGYRVEDFAADVPLLLDALGVGRAVLAGHSGSCLVARRVTLDHPGRVAGLVLESSPTTLRGNVVLGEFVELVVSGLADPIDPTFARSFVSDTSSEDLEPAVVEQLTTELLKVPARVWKATFAGLLVHDDLDEIDRIAAPTLLVWGDADQLVSRDMQVVLASRIRGAELVVYDGIGHTPRWEDPGRFARDLVRFVEGTAQLGA